MRSRRIAGTVAAVGLCCGWGVSAAVILAPLKNTIPLLNTDDSRLVDGSMLQLIHTGLNFVVDPPDLFGDPGGDDYLVTITLNPTAVGEGIGPAGTGQVESFGITYDNALIGTTNAYVRFWNGSEPYLATHYGVSDLVDLPMGDMFLSFAELDFVPLISNPHQVNVMFNAQQALIVPEPSSFAFLAFLSTVLLVRRRWQEAARVGTFVLPFALLALGCGGTAHAQIPARLDVNATVSVVDGGGNVLPGNHPDAADFGFTPIPGSVVQLLNAGANGVADLPDGQGFPTGDDTVLETSQVGAGIFPNIPQSGRFSFSLTPGPQNGTKVFVRIFDQPTVAASTQWGQSNCFEVDGNTVFTVNRLGLWGTIVPKTGDPGGVDTDGDGHNDLAELIANTSAGDASDFLAASTTTRTAGGVQVALDARAGRDYRLMRKADGLMSATAWVPVASVDAMTAPQEVVLEDPSPPPDASEVYYTIDAAMP